MKISVKDFPNRETGYTERHNLEGMRVQLMRIEEGINVYIENLESEVKATCDKCLQEYKQKVQVPEAERIFYFKKPPNYDQEADQADIFMVDMKHQEIDLTELLRQEILLHFPTSLVCSGSCKGLCLKCGANLNDKDCNCDKNDSECKPLAGLKDMVRNNETP